MRRLIVVAPLAAGLAACGSSHVVRPQPVEFGRTGGNIRPFRRETLPRGPVQSQLRAAFAAGLASRQCPGTLPDFATEYIRFDGRTVRVRGNCEPAFTRLWNQLTGASGTG